MLETIEVAKPSKFSPPLIAVRTRRAYFDFQHGQLHVRTAFPTTGGFDEQVTLICLHGGQDSSRSFAKLLPEIADVRSVYAPDLPGCGESDPSPHGTTLEAAGAVADLAGDLRLRQIDLLGVNTGAHVALELAAAKPELVRRLVLVGIPAAERLPNVKQPALVMRTRMEGVEGLPRAKAALPNGKFVDVPDHSHDLFEAAPEAFAKQVGAFLSGRA
jgi:pimeloyl-ACP methyl ester carboxylesterase